MVYGDLEIVVGKPRENSLFILNFNFLKLNFVRQSGKITKTQKIHHFSRKNEKMNLKTI